MTPAWQKIVVCQCNLKAAPAFHLYLEAISTLHYPHIGHISTYLHNEDIFPLYWRLYQHFLYIWRLYQYFLYIWRLYQHFICIWRLY